MDFVSTISVQFICLSIYLYNLTVFLFYLQDKGVKERLEKIEQNAKSVLAVNSTMKIEKDSGYFKRNASLAHEPIFIASTERIGTHRVRANHFDAAIDFFTEQEQLKKANAPM